MVILQQPQEQDLYFYSMTATKKSCSSSSIEEQSRSICEVILIQNWGENCYLLYPRNFKNAGDWFYIYKENRFYSFNQRCKCLYYILLKLPAINNVVDICLSMKCFIRGSLIWNSNASPKWILTGIYKINITSKKLNPHVIDKILNFKYISMSSHCAKKRDVYHFS